MIKKNIKYYKQITKKSQPQIFVGPNNKYGPGATFENITEQHLGDANRTLF